MQKLENGGSKNMAVSMIFRPLLLCLTALVFTAYGVPSAQAKADLAGKWAGTFSCGDARAGKVTIDISTEQEPAEGLLKFDSPQMKGSLKVKVRSDQGGRIAFLPLAWVDQPELEVTPTLIGTLGADAITGTLSGCKGNAAISLVRAAEPELAAIQAGSLLEPAPVSGGIAHGHWQGTLACKRSERKPAESLPVEADIVQDGNGVAALFGIRIPLTPGDTSGPTHNQTVLFHGILSESGLKLSDPTYLAKGNGWRLKGLSVTFGDGGQSASGTPDMNKCDSIALTKVGPPITPQIPNEWAGLWQGTVGRTRSTVTFVPQANPSIVELRSEFPTTAPLADQGHLIAALVPFYAKNGKVLLVLAGTRAGTGEFRNANTPNAGKHDYIHTRAFLMGAQGADAIIVSRVRWDDGLQNFFADPQPMRLNTEHADLLLKRVDATSAQLMASDKKPPLSLAGSLGGTLAQASTLKDQCEVLGAWIKPSADRGGGKLTYEAMLDAFHDDPFVSVFGLPFPLLSPDERRAIAVLTRHCRQELGTAALSDELTTTFEIALLHKNAVKAMDARIATTGWRDNKRKEIAALPEEPGSLAKLKQIEAESRKTLENFTQAERDQFKAELAARSAEIDGALLRRSVADVLNAPGGTNTLDELGALRRKIADSSVPAEIKQELAETVVVKAKTIATTLYNEAVAKAIAAPRSLEGLATIHSIRLSMAHLANRMQTDFGVDRGDSLESALALERAMLSAPAVQSAFRDKMMAVDPNGDPVDSIREAASAYLDIDRLGDNSPPFGAYTQAVEVASAHAEIASIDFQDVSGMSNPDEPTAEEMLKLVLQRVHKVNDGMHDRMERCRANNYQNDPVLAVTCIQLFPVIIGQPHNSEFRVRLKSFSKLGCVPISGNTQFDCQFETALSSNIDPSMGELGRIFSTPGVQTARMVHNADGGWSMIY